MFLSGFSILTYPRSPKRGDCKICSIGFIPREREKERERERERNTIYTNLQKAGYWIISFAEITPVINSRKKKSHTICISWINIDEHSTARNLPGICFMVQKRMRKEFTSFVCFTMLQRNSWPQTTNSFMCTRTQTNIHTHKYTRTCKHARLLCARLCGLKIFGLESWVYPYTTACLCQKERCNNIVEPKLGQQWQTLCDLPLTKVIVLMHKLLYQTFPFSDTYLSNKG